MHRVAISICATAVLVTLGVVGCKSKSPITEGTVAPSDQQLTQLGRIYKQAEERLGRPPRNADELKPYAGEVGDFDALLISPNDRQPFVVAWGTPLASTADQDMVVIYEKTGTMGFRHVLTPSGTRILDEQAFAQAHFPKGHAPAQP